MLCSHCVSKPTDLALSSHLWVTSHCPVWVLFAENRYRALVKTKQLKEQSVPLASATTMPPLELVRKYVFPLLAALLPPGALTWRGVWCQYCRFALSQASATGGGGGDFFDPCLEALREYGINAPPPPPVSTVAVGGDEVNGLAQVPVTLREGAPPVSASNSVTQRFPTGAASAGSVAASTTPVGGVETPAVAGKKRARPAPVGKSAGGTPKPTAGASKAPTNITDGSRVGASSGPVTLAARFDPPLAFEYQFFWPAAVIQRVQGLSNTPASPFSPTQKTKGATSAP